LRWYERVIAVALGLGAGGAGGVAVFVTSNQAGAASLVIVGATLLLIGIQGTRLLKFGGGGTTIEMARAQLAVRLLDRARTEEDAEVAEGIAQAAEMVSPVVPAGGVHVSRYEDELARALEAVGVTVHREQTLGVGRPVDFVVETSGGSHAVVETKPRRYGTLTMRDVSDVIEQLGALGRGNIGDAGLLVVTNAPLSGEVQEFNAERTPSQRPVEVISWNDDRDNAHLGRALARVVR